MKWFYFILIIPGMMLGWLLGTLFIGIVPTIMCDTFVYQCHYLPAAKMWVRISGGIGMFLGVIIAIVGVIAEKFDR